MVACYESIDLIFPDRDVNSPSVIKQTAGPKVRIREKNHSTTLDVPYG
jgi:hypothetical protein